MLDLQQLEVDEIATALSDQTDYDHRWLIDPRSGQIAFWTSDTGIDGEPVISMKSISFPSTLSPPMSGTRTWPTSQKESATTPQGDEE